MISRLRNLYTGPILVLSTHASKHEEIQVLQAGADQYLEIGKHLDVERCLANAITGLSIRNSVTGHPLIARKRWTGSWNLSSAAFLNGPSASMNLSF